MREAGLDLTGWLEYFVSGLATQLQELEGRGQQVLQVETLTQRFMLNPRQVEALRFLSIHPSLTIQDFEQLHPTVARRTLQRDLSDLLAKGLIRELALAPTDPNRRYAMSYDKL